MIHTSRTARSYRKLPAYQQRQILDLYRASADTLGANPRERRRAFVDLLRLYFPFYSAMDLQSAYDVVRRHEEFHMQSRLIRRIHGEYGHRIVRLFGKWDANGDSAISLDEFREAMCATALSRAHVDVLFARADADGNGELSLDEMVDFLARSPTLLTELEGVLSSSERAETRRRRNSLALLFSDGAAERLSDPRVRPSLADVRPHEEQTRYLSGRPDVWL
jgi:hypothetical protein